jgi:hypothetical protein
MVARLAIGFHGVQAVYTPASDSPLAGGTSQAFTITIGKSPTPGGSIGSNVQPAAIGQSVTYSAFFGGWSEGPPTTGTIAFSDGNTLLAMRPVSAADSTLTATMTTAGLHMIRATYSGDDNYLPATARNFLRLWARSRVTSP